MLVLIAAVAALGGCQDFQNATDYRGDDLPGGTHANVTAPGCCALCAATAGCNAWSLWVSGAQCSLKASGKGSQHSDDYVSGVPRGYVPSHPRPAPCPFFSRYGP